MNNTGNTTQLLTSFNALDVAQQKVLLSSKLLTEEQKSQCATMVALSSVNSKYTAEQLTRVAGVSAETLANWGLVDSTDSLTIAELAELAVSDKQAKNVLDKIIAQNAQAVANGEVTASNIALASSEGGATLATGAFTTAIKANISAMWTWMTTTPLGWLTLLVAGVFAAVKAYDALTVSVEEQKEKMEESLSAYEDAKSELSSITTELENQEQAMNELLAKEKLTYAEKGQLEELQAITRELRIQKDLAEKEEDRTEKQLAKDATDLFDRQFGDYEISEQAINKYQSDSDITGNNAILISDENDISAMIAGYKQFNELLDEAYGSGSQDDIDHFKSLTEDLEDSIFTTAQELQTQQDNISAYYESIKNTPYEDLTTEQKEIVDTYNAISNAIALIYQQLDPNTWNSMQVDNIFSTDGIEKTKDELVAMAQSGELTPETIKGYINLNNALGETTLSAQDLCDELYAIADAQGKVQGSTLDNEINLFDTSVFSEIVDKLSSVKTAYSDFRESFADNEKFIPLDIVDLEGWDEAIKSLKGFEEFEKIVTSSNSTFEEVEMAFDQLATEYIYTSNCLKGLTTENRNQIVSQLELRGIVNANEIVTEELAKAYEDAAKSGVDLSNATLEEITALAKEKSVTKESAEQMLEYYTNKVKAGLITFDTSNDVTQLMNELNMLGLNISALQEYYRLKRMEGSTFGLGSGNYTPNGYNGKNSTYFDKKFSFDKEDLYDVDLTQEEKDNLGSGSGSGGKNAKDTAETFDWIETLISRIQRSITNLGKTLSATYKQWSTRNNALAKEMQLVNQEIGVQQKAYNAYMAEANKIDLDERYKKLVRDGDYSIAYSDNEKLNEKIDLYKEW